MQRLADVKFKIHNHNTTQKTRQSSLVFVLWKPHLKRVTVGTFLQTISLPLADVAARGTTNHPAGRQRLRPRQQPKRQGAQRSTWRKSVLVRPAWQQAWTGRFGPLGAFFWILLMFRMFILSCSWKDSPNIIVIMMITMILMIMIIMMIMMVWWLWWLWSFWWLQPCFFDWTHVLDIALARLAFWTYQAFWSHGHLRCCLQGELAAESGNTAMKSAEIAAKALLVTGETFFFQRSENGYEGWRFVGSTPHPGFQSTTRMITCFRFGNPFIITLICHWPRLPRSRLLLQGFHPTRLLSRQPLRQPGG